MPSRLIESQIVMVAHDQEVAVNKIRQGEADRARFRKQMGMMRRETDYAQDMISGMTNTAIIGPDRHAKSTPEVGPINGSERTAVR